MIKIILSLTGAPSLSEPIIIKDPLRHVTRGQNLRVNCTTDIEMDIPYDLTWIYPKHVIYFILKINYIIYL